MKLLTVTLFLLPLLISRLYKDHAILMRFLFNRKRKASRDPEPPRKMIEQDSRLLTLPDEILINIVAHLDYKLMLTARLVSTHFQALIEPFIYEDYAIDDGHDSQRLADLIDSDPKRATWLRSVLVSTKFDEDERLYSFPDSLAQMRNLKHLVLETPDCNAKAPWQRYGWVELQKRYEAVLKASTLAIPVEDRLLPQLRTMTMHLVDEKSSLYRLPKYCSIFIHPTLKSLTLSCACTDSPEALLAKHRKFKRTTALEYLHLEECDLDPKTLELLLKFPRNLISLKISEGKRYDEGFGSRQARLHGDVRPGALSSALTRSVGDTLEILDLALGIKNTTITATNIPGRALDLRRMTRLRDLALSWDSLTLVCTRPTCDHELYRRLPQTIETLRVFSIPVVNVNGGPVIPFKSCVFKRKAAHGLPNLTQLVYRYEYQALRERSEYNFPGADTIHKVMSAYVDSIPEAHDRGLGLYKKSGVRVLVELERTPAGYIPPYLNNEEHPVIETFWDSDDFNLDGRRQAGVEDEEAIDEDLEVLVGRRRLEDLFPPIEYLVNFLVTQPGRGMPT